jgi:DNA invertase Pin-like site-specific DNA recombinase
LARNSKHLLEFIEQVKTQKVDILFIKENLHFKSQDNDFVSELILQIIGAVSQFELAMITERRKEGIANAKAKGKYKGRAKNTANEYQAHKLRAAGYSFQAIADKIGCARSTVQRYLANKVEVQSDLEL